MEVASALDIEVLSYVRAEDGLVTPMHDIPREAGHSAGGLPSFGVFDSAEGGGSILRVVNTEAERARWTTGGYDDRGEGLTGSLGDGYGKWRLRVESDVPLAVMSLVESRDGHLVNVSTGTAD